MDSLAGTRFDLGNRLSIGLDDADPVTQRRVGRELEPFPPALGNHPAALVLERVDTGQRPDLVDVQGLAADGSVTASDGRSIYAVIEDRVATIPDPWRDDVVRFSYQPGFPILRLFSSLVRPSIQVGLLLRDAATVHAACVETDGSAILIAGWSESGKTETALALMEGEARFISDKWTVSSADGMASAFPISVGIRRWVLPYLPTLRGAMPRGSTAQFFAASAGRLALTPVMRLRRRGAVAGLVQQAARQGLALADRVALSPLELRSIYAQRDEPTRPIPARAVVLLTTVPAGSDPKLVPADRDWLIERLVRAAAFERRAFFAWQERAAYALPSRWSDPSLWMDRERGLLHHGLGGAELVHIEAPFPADPRPVADLIRKALR